MTNTAIVFDLYSTSFCAACARTRTVLELAVSVLPGSIVREHDLAFQPDLAEADGIEMTPTVVIRDTHGVEVFRASGVPTVEQVLKGAVLAVESTAG